MIWWWLLLPYVFIGCCVLFGWADGDNSKSDSFIMASTFLWPLHLLWTILRGIPEILGFKRGPVRLTRKQERDILYRKQRNEVEREWQKLTGHSSLSIGE